MILLTLARRAGTLGLGVAITGLWAGLAAWALYSPHTLAWAFLAVAGVCGGLTGALAVLAITGPPGSHRGRAWPGWAPPRTPDRPTAVLDGHVVPAGARYEYGIPSPEPAPAGPPWGPAPRPATARPPSWGAYPAPHYDDDDTCRCPDHETTRQLRDWGL